MLLLEHFQKVLGELLIEILTTEMRISRSSDDFKHTVSDGHKGNIECTTSEIKDNHVLFRATLIKTVCDSGSSWLVNDSQNFKPGDLTGILCRGSLGIIEVSRHSDDGMLYFFANVRFSGLLHFNQNHS